MFEGGLLSWGATGWGDEIAFGTAVTVALAISALPLGLLIGLASALARRSGSTLAQQIAVAYCTVFRGLPELLTVFLIFYGGQLAITAATRALGWDYVEFSPFFAGMLALGLVFGAFASEVFVAALGAISRGQREAASALGLSKHQAFRLVVAPQMFRHALPGLSNLWLILLKDTSLISVIALDDLMRASRVASASESEPVYFYLVAFAIYLALSLVSSIGIGRLRRSTERGMSVAR